MHADRAKTHQIWSCACKDREKSLKLIVFLATESFEPMKSTGNGISSLILEMIDRVLNTVYITKGKYVGSSRG
jgi:hypothetical protein